MSAPQVVTDDRSYVSAPAFVRALSPEARSAFAVADAYRRGARRGGIDVEHLLVGMYGYAETARPAFHAADVGDEEFVRRLHDAGFDTPFPVGSASAGLALYDVADATLDPAPRLTQPVLDIVNRAERLASTGPMTAGTIDTLHLFRAVAASPHPAARLFADVWKYLDNPSKTASTSAERPTSVGQVGVGLQLVSIYGSLSISARNALGVAEALRTDRRRDAVHMEHFVVGLHAQEGGHARETFEVGGMTVERLRDTLATLELPLVIRLLLSDKPGLSSDFLLPPRVELATMPPTSRHVQSAILEGARIAGWSFTGAPQPGLIQARHLLLGMLAVRECHVVQALEPMWAAVVEALADAIRRSRHASTTTKRSFASSSPPATACRGTSCTPCVPSR